MLFDVCMPIKTKAGDIAPGVKTEPKSLNQAFDLVTNSKKYRGILQRVINGEKEFKTQLPVVCFMGKGSLRSKATMQPTQFIMIDIDHMEDVERSWNTLKTVMGKEYLDNKLLVAHKTPSGKGLRIVVVAPQGVTSIPDALTQLNREFHFDHHGDFDEKCCDISRSSFLVSWDYVYQFNQDLAWQDDFPEGQIVADAEADEDGNASAAKKAEEDGGIPDFTEEEIEKYENMAWRGVPVKPILQKYIEVNGIPESGDGEAHNYYNDLIKNFRCLTSNKKRCLLYLLPAIGHTKEERWSQIKHICKSNTLSSLPKELYFFMKDNGFYVSRKQAMNMQDDSVIIEDETNAAMPPFLPPIFRDVLRGAPADFVVPGINALMPILGTLTSYVQARYPYDDKLHTTSFFSIITAPPGSGKSFVERFMDMFFKDIRLRDLIQEKREALYLKYINRKGDNERSPENPQTSMRLIPAKNSETEFLEKQQINHGYHMFTYAAEMDSWAKGVKAAGGNKDDMVRIAWDNGEYGQAFKSSNSFKGTVRLYWNLLILGTWDQVERYFKSVENGLVQRCCFTELQNQEFASPMPWAPMTEQEKKRVEEFCKKCDAATYEEPCNVEEADVEGLNEKQFDEEIPWRFKFREKQTIDMGWIMPVIDAFHKEQVEIAVRDVDRARDVFRRRTGVRGFRLALECTQVYTRFTSRDKENVKKFVDWWMHIDLEESLRLWGAKYNELANTSAATPQRSVYTGLAEEFTKADIYTVCLKQGIKTELRKIIYQWKKIGIIEEVGKGMYKKIDKNGQSGKCKNK